VVICGSLLSEDVVARFQRLKILVNCKAESMISAYHVSDGTDCCCDGFLKSKLAQFSDPYEGVLASISRVHPGSSVAVIISCYAVNSAKSTA